MDRGPNIVTLRWSMRGILEGVSQVDRDRTAKVLEDLPPEERAWLDEQLATYRELLSYLHDH